MPGGDLATMLEAERDLDVRATQVLAESTELDRIARRMAAELARCHGGGLRRPCRRSTVALHGISATHRKAAV